MATAIAMVDDADASEVATGVNGLQSAALRLREQILGFDVHSYQQVLAYCEAAQDIMTVNDYHMLTDMQQNFVLSDHRNIAAITQVTWSEELDRVQCTRRVSVKGATAREGVCLVNRVRSDGHIEFVLSLRQDQMNKLKDDKEFTEYVNFVCE